MRQMQLDFEPGLTDRHKSLRSVLAATIYGARKGLSAVAADCDLSPSELCKQLSQDESRKLDVDLIERIVRATGDCRPVYYLIERLCEPKEAKQARALEALSELAEELPRLLREAKGWSK